MLDKESEEEEGAIAWQQCKKNRGHPNFIPASDFCLDHLPEKFRCPKALEYVKTISALTVMLRVGYTSWERPNYFAFSQHRGSDVQHTGSALVSEITEHDGPCQCSECDHSPLQSRPQKWFEIHLETALHVIYNTEEAQASRVDFFYDDERAIAEGRKKTLWATEVRKAHSQGDFCSFVCVTHNLDLAQRLQEYLRKSTKAKFYGLSGRWMASGWDNMCVMASHPHGQPKKITLGRLMNEHEITPAHRYYVYSLDTCPGSSGARGAVVEFSRYNNKSFFSLSLLPPHSRRTGNTGINVSTSSAAGYMEPGMAALFENMKFSPLELISAVK